MSEEHYPVGNTGNVDIVALNFPKMIDSMMSGEFIRYATKSENDKEPIADITGNYFDDELSYSKHSN